MIPLDFSRELYDHVRDSLSTCDRMLNRMDGLVQSKRIDRRRGKFQDDKNCSATKEE